MKKISLLVLSLVMVLGVALFIPIVTPPTVHAANVTYYVDPNGNDSNNGTSTGSAWKTLSKVSSVTFVPGDVILFKKGETFSGTLTLKGSGNSSNYITVDSYGSGNAPILTTNAADTVVKLYNVSYWNVQNLEITAPNGAGLHIDSPNANVSNINITNIKFHNIQGATDSSRHDFGTPVDMKQAIQIGLNREIGNPSNYPSIPYTMSYITINNCEFTNVGNGVHFNGNWPEAPNAPLTHHLTVKNSYFHDMVGEGVVVAQTKYSLVDNSRFINTASKQGTCVAPVWFWGADQSIVQNSEIAFTKNTCDGMAFDFDDHTTNSIYQYNYSHNNNKFMKNCFTSEHTGNIVRYNISYNDGPTESGSPEKNFKFYNNTLINAMDIKLYGDNQTIKNNIFYMYPGSTIDVSGSNISRSNNLYYNMTGSEPGVVNANPILSNIDVQTAGSKLATTSPARNAGTIADTDMGSRDFFGTSWTSSTHNIGAYEGTGVPFVAGPASLDGGVFRIANRANENFGVDAATIPVANDTVIQAWQYVGSANQNWKMVSVGGGYYKIVSMVDQSYCIDAAVVPITNDTKVHVWTYVGSTNQQWKPVYIGGGYYKIVNRADENYVMDAATNPIVNGTKIHMWQYTGDINQKWRFISN